MDEFKRQGLDPGNSSLKFGIFGAEPWTNAMRAEIEQAFDMDATDIYGLSEVIGPGVAQECVESKDGLHIWEDYFYPEVIDPDTGAVLPDGEKGELVFTSLTKQGFPIIRYRTRDLTRLLPGTARPGMRRMEKVTWRSDDMIILRGVNVFPTQIEEEALLADRLVRRPFHHRTDARRADGRDDRARRRPAPKAGTAADCTAMPKRSRSSSRTPSASPRTSRPWPPTRWNVRSARQNVFTTSGRKSSFLILMVRRRVSAVSNHVAPLSGADSSFETPLTRLLRMRMRGVCGGQNDRRSVSLHPSLCRRQLLHRNDPDKSRIENCSAQRRNIRRATLRQDAR